MGVQRPQHLPSEEKTRDQVDLRDSHTGFETARDRILFTSFVDPNTLNLDPDLEFWLNLDPHPDPEFFQV